MIQESKAIAGMSEKYLSVRTSMLRACRTQIEQTCDCIRIFLVETDDGQLHQVLAPAREYEQEASDIAQLGLRFLRMEVRRMTMVSGAWVSANPEYSKNNGLEPRLDPERGEVMLCVDSWYEGGTRQSEVTTWVITPSADRDKAVIADKPKISTAPAGRYTEILPPIPVRGEALRTMIDRILEGRSEMIPLPDDGNKAAEVVMAVMAEPGPNGGH